MVQEYIIHGQGYCGKDANICYDSCKISHEKLSICLTWLPLINMC